MAIVLITGCNGFLGKALTQVIARNYPVVGLDNEAPKKVQPLTEFVPVDFSSGRSVRDALRHVAKNYGGGVAAVIHLAAYYSFSGEPSPSYEAINVRGTERLLHELASFDVEMFAFASTMLVHAPTEPGVSINEDSPIEPQWDYPKSKWQAEELIRRQGQGVRPVILRIAGVYDDLCHSPTLANPIQRIFERKLVSRLFPGELSHGQSFVHVADIVDAFVRLLRNREDLAGTETFLLGEPETLSCDELERALRELIHDEEPFTKPWMIDLADDHFELDVTRSWQALRWVPTRRLRSTLPVMVEHLLSDPARFYRENMLEAPAWLEQEPDAPRAHHASHPG
jgi:nucleoside-diphosphate-sugar epimerase